MRRPAAGWSIAAVVFGAVDAGAVRGLWGALTNAQHLPAWAVASLCALYAVVTTALFVVGYGMTRRLQRGSDERG